MKKMLFTLMLSGFGLAALGQSENQTNVFNLGFEEFLPGTAILKDWNIKDGQSIPCGTLHVDKELKHSGNQSLLIERNNTKPEYDYRKTSIKINIDFEVQTISGSLWIKTEDLSTYASIWLYLEDAEGNKIKELQIPFVSNSPEYDTITGTHDWKYFWFPGSYLPPDAHSAYFCIAVNGTGKLWVDDVDMYLNGASVKFFKRQPKIWYKAYSDTKEFRDGSGITIDNVTPFQLKSLSLLCKTWGFLKYYHPAVASGNYNWDFELFRFLPGYLNLKTKESINEALVHWINNLGKIPECKNCQNPIIKTLQDTTTWPKIKKPCCDDSLKLKVWYPDFEWMNDKTVVSDSLSSLLNFIRENRYQGKQFYISLSGHVRSPHILHEDWYDQFTNPDPGYKLLSLFRYWNLVQYWFPNKHLMDENWEDVLIQFIPKIISTSNAIDYILATEQLIAKIQDSHAIIMQTKNDLLTRFRGIYYAPVSLKFVNDEPVVMRVINDSLARASDLKRGDIIKSIDGKKINEIIIDRLPNLPASNYPTQLRDLAGQLLRSNDKTSYLTVEREGKVFTTKLHRFKPKYWGDILPYNYQFPYIVDSSFFFIRPGIGYISISGIKSAQIDSVFTLLKKSKGLIIDCRVYPGDNLNEICKNLYPEEKLFILFRFGNEYYPGLFANYSAAINPITIGKKNENYYKGKVIILIDENSQSQAEWEAMRFRQAPGSVVIGSTTAGADGGMSMFYLPGRIFTGFSGISPLNPDESETQRVGIIPDIEVKPTVQGIKDGIDEYVKKAIEIINSQ